MEATTLQERDWSSLPVDVLAQFLSRIKWSSHPSFGLVCRQWQSARALSPFYPTWITPLLLNIANVGTTSFRYYSPYYHKNFEIDTKLEAPAGVKIFCATGGLHVTLGLLDKVVNADLGTGEACELPPVTQPKFDFAVHRGVGKKRNRMYGVNVTAGIDVSHATRRSNGEWGEWKVQHIMDYHNPTAFTPSPDCNPVLRDCSLYIMGTDGRLVVYDRKGRSRHGQRSEILDKPWGWGFRFKFNDCYLFESGRRKLMAVLVGHRGTPVNILKLNKRTMKWEKTESIEGFSLFTMAFLT